MPEKTATAICAGTPVIIVSDNRGLAIRNINYNRTTASESVKESISRTTYGSTGSGESSIDARLFAAQQNNSRTVENLKNKTSLSGRLLRRDSVDSGWAAALANIEGQKVWHKDGNGTETQSFYDKLGRITHNSELVKGATKEKIRERFIYGDSAAKANNLCGQLTHHYDTAGLSQITSISLSGKPLNQARQLLANIDQESDWQGTSESQWSALLAKDKYTTQWQYSAIGQLLKQTDAKDNIQRSAYDIAGQLLASWLTIASKTEQAVLKQIEYDAAGLVLKEVAGNGTITEYEYEQSTRRLIGIKTSRPKSGSTTPEILQDLRYEYDPVGNVLLVKNDAEATRFYRNQKVVPESSYQYDALYQLISASGREADSNRNRQHSPELITPMPGDSSQYVNYTRIYTYDIGGNLIQIKHTGASQYTTDITVSATSNRAIDKSNSTTIDKAFDTNGNLLQLQTGIDLVWNARNQLIRVNTVTRQDAVNDDESYLYSTQGSRIVKSSSKKASNITVNNQVIYLPGLELRTEKKDDKVSESLQVINLFNTGRGQIKVLHWENNTAPSGISNDQFRYSFADAITSSMLELDQDAQIISHEEYYPFGGTALWSARSAIEANYKTIRYSGKELDATGLYYYGYRYSIPWIGRWLNPDPLGAVAGLNLYCFVNNNPTSDRDIDGLVGVNDLHPIMQAYVKGQFAHDKYGYSLTKIIPNVNWPKKTAEEAGMTVDEHSLASTIHNDPSINTYSPMISMVSKDKHAEMLTESRSSGIKAKLTDAQIESLTSYGITSVPFHMMIGGTEYSTEKYGSFKKFNPGQISALVEAVNIMKPYKATAYRGFLADKSSYEYPGMPDSQRLEHNFLPGDYISTDSFFSTSTKKEISDRFVFHQRFGNEFHPKTVMMYMSAESGANITEFTQEEQAEVLMLPGTIFKISDIQKDQFGVNIYADEDTNLKWSQGGGVIDKHGNPVVVREYRFGHTMSKLSNLLN